MQELKTDTIKPVVTGLEIKKTPDLRANESDSPLPTLNLTKMSKLTFHMHICY